MREQWVCSRERIIALYKRTSINQSMETGRHWVHLHRALTDGRFSHEERWLNSRCQLGYSHRHLPLRVLQWFTRRSKGAMGSAWLYANSKQPSSDHSDHSITVTTVSNDCHDWVRHTSSETASFVGALMAVSLQPHRQLISYQAAFLFWRWECLCQYK